MALLSRISHLQTHHYYPYYLVAALSLVVTAVLATTWLTTRLRQFYRLRRFDGPLLAKLSKWWMIRTVASGEAYLRFWGVTQQYGEIARIGPNDLITSDPDLIKHMYQVRSDYTRSDWYEGMRFNPARDNLLSLRSEDDHRQLRSQMAAGYSGREIEGLEPKIDRNIVAFTQLLGKYADKGVPVDFGRKAQFFTLDVISHVAFGEPFGFVATDSDVYKYIETTEATLPMVMVTTVVPWVVKLLSSPILSSVLPSAKDSIGFGKLMGIAKKVAADRYSKEGKGARDMLGSFIAHGLTQEQAESEILLQIIAGSDTTATVIRSTMLHIITNPRVLSKLVAEFSAHEAFSSSAVISDEAARSLPYLQAVIKEGMRIFPPVAGLMAKQAPEAGHQWKEDVFIPGGTRVGYCAWGLFRRPDIWGDDAAEFRPERWLEAGRAAGGDKLQRMEGTLELIFSYGKWQCLGRPIALIELNKVFVQLLREFDFSICNPTNPWKIFNCGIFSQSDFLVRVERK